MSSMNVDHWGKQESMALRSRNVSEHAWPAQMIREFPAISMAKPKRTRQRSQQCLVEDARVMYLSPDLPTSEYRVVSFSCGRGFCVKKSG